MKRFISKLSSYFVAFLFCTVLLAVLSLPVRAVGPAPERTYPIGETKTLSFSGGSSGYTLSSYSPIYSSNPSVVSVEDYGYYNSGSGYVTIRTLSEGSATIYWSMNVSYRRWDSVLGYWQTDTQYRSGSFPITVEGCSSHDYYKQTVTYPSVCTDGLYRFTCSLCNDSYTRREPAPHNYDTGKLTTPPKPDTDGVTTKTCTLCGDTTTVAFDKSHAAHITAQPKDGYATTGKTAKVTLKAEGDGLKYQWYVKNRGSKKFSKSSATTAVYTTSSMNADKSGRQVYCIVKDKYGNKVRSNTVTIYSNPDITKQPANTKVYRDEQAKCSVKVYGTGLTYQWYMKNKGASKFSKSANKTAEYRCLMDDKSDGRQVYCVVTDKKGNKTKTKTATISMKPDRPVFITKQPVNTSNYANKKVSVSVKATGKDKKYQWYFKDKGNSKFKKATITTAAYSVTMNADREGRQVYCVIKDAYGNSVKSKTATLGMKRASKITKQPVDTTAYNGKELAVGIKATGDGIKYQWYVINTNGTAGKSSVTSSIYTVEMSKKVDGRKVYCVVTDKYGNKVQSKTVTLSMSNKITITKQPKDGCFEYKTKASATVKATGEGLTYQWYIKNRNASKFTKSSVTSPTYTCVMGEAQHDRQVYCVVTDKYGLSQKSETATLKVDLVIKAHPNRINVNTGDVGRVYVDATGVGLTYRWYYLPDGSSTEAWINNDAWIRSSVTTPYYEVKISDSYDRRNQTVDVFCRVTDAFGQQVDTYKGGIYDNKYNRWVGEEEWWKD